MNHKNKLKILRKQLPISIKHGLELLNQTNGNIEEATQLFKDFTFKQLNSKMKLNSEIVQNLLFETNYNLELAIEKAEKLQFSPSEIILRKSISNREKIDFIVTQIEQENNLIRKYITHTKEELAQLSFHRKVIVTLYDWLNNHESDYEFNIGCGLMKTSCYYIEIIFKMPKLSNAVLNADKLYDEIVIPWNSEMKLYYESKKQLKEDKQFKNNLKIFISKRVELYEKMIEFIKENISKFP